MDIIARLAELFIGGHGLGSVIANTGKGAALVPVIYWLFANRDTQFTCFTLGQAAVVGLIVFAVIVAAHRAPGPGQG